MMGSTSLPSGGKAHFFPPRELGTLEVGGKKEVDYHYTYYDKQTNTISGAYQPRFEAEYQDIYEEPSAKRGL